jgi:outer membrane protein assembly factor BamB
VRGHRRTLASATTVVLILTCLLASSPNASATMDDWPMFRHDPAHSGYTTDTPQNYARPLWNATVGAQVWSSPAVVDGSVVVGCRDGNLYCLDAQDGSLHWNYHVGTVIQFSSPAVVDGRAYIGGDSGAVYCVNATNGEPIWMAPTSGMIRSSPVVVDDRLYIGSSDFSLYCFNASDGTIIWSTPTYGTIDSSPAVADGVVYIGSTDGNIYAVNAATGESIWNQRIQSIGSSPTVYNGAVYVGANDGAIYAFNSTNGTSLWRFQTENTVFSSPAAAYGYIYVGSEDNSLYCLNATTGEKVWSSPTGYWVWSSPSVANGFVYVGSEDNCLYCFDALTGAKQWAFETGNPIDTSPAIVGGNIYFGSEDCRVYALTTTPEKTADQSSSNGVPANVIAFDAALTAIIAIVVFVAISRIRSDLLSKASSHAETKGNPLKTWALAHTDALFIAIIFSFSAVFYVYIGNGSLWAADEQTYTQMAYHMLKSGDYLTPFVSGAVATWAGKPPLFMALMSVSYQIFGVTNFAARVVSSVFGTLSLVAMFYLGKLLYNKYVGFASAIILGTFTTFFVFARHAMIDVTLVFFMLTSIYFLVYSEKVAKRSNWLAALGGVLFGLAFMTKQTEALLGLIVVALYLVLTNRSLKVIFKKKVLLFLGFGLIVFGPWLILMYANFGWHFVDWYFFYSNFTRSTTAIEGHVGNYWYYFDYMLRNENPVWVLILPFATGLCAFKAVFRRSKADILVLEWMVVVLAVFTFAQTKLYWYIIPALPAFALAIGSFLFMACGRIRVFRAHRRVQEPPAQRKEPTPP